MPAIYSLLIILLCSLSAYAETNWDEQTFPNPMTDGFQACGMDSSALICDVDKILSQDERNALNQQLFAFQNDTYDPQEESPCKRKGTTVAIAIVDKLVEDMMKQERLSYFAVYLHTHWSLDPECLKSIVLLLPTKNWRLISRDFHYEAPVFFDEFSYLFFREQELFKNASYYAALTNIVHGLHEAILLKQKQNRRPIKAGIKFDSSTSFQSTTELETTTSTEQTEASSSTKELEVQNTTTNRQTTTGDVTTDDDGVELHDAILNATTVEPTKKSLKSLECACQQNIFSGAQLGVTIATVLICLLGYSLICRLCECVYFWFKRGSSYNVGRRERLNPAPSVSYHNEDFGLSTTKLNEK
ncbi:modulator of levamisole receptor-1 domain-containing protein [Ditylenchus destructor]|nr:modulator of levamisole receptor-1 domain-containing protein [Ditylenchus destructor]